MPDRLPERRTDSVPDCHWVWGRLRKRNIRAVRQFNWPLICIQMIREQSMRQIPDRPFGFPSQQHFPSVSVCVSATFAYFWHIFYKFRGSLTIWLPSSLLFSPSFSIFVCVTIFTLCHKMFTVDLYNECVCVCVLCVNIKAGHKFRIAIWKYFFSCFIAHFSSFCGSLPFTAH